MLGEYLEHNCPDVSVQVVVKSSEDWGEYIDSVSETIMLDFYQAKWRMKRLVWDSDD